MSDSDPGQRRPLFSKRFAHLDTGAGRLTEEVARLRAAGRPLLDLTVSDPTRVGLDYPDRRIRDCLGAAVAGPYEPEPLGLAVARQAVADYYRRRGARVASERVLITASTSEAYAMLFKVLADPGDRILVPTPSYPLFDFLAAAEGIGTVPYSLHDSGGWHLDTSELTAAVTPETRAVVVVHPNNPTGHYLRPEEWGAVQELAARHNLAVVADEVFFDYPLSDTTRPLDPAAAECPALTFVLNGLSKTAGLPQLKLGWVVVQGPVELAETAMKRLEVVSDTYLSVATPVQRALGGLFGVAPQIRHVILDRVRSSAVLLQHSELECLTVDGGWSAPVRLPATRSGEQWALMWLREHGVSSYPGELFGFAGPHLVVSLLTPSSDLKSAVNLLA